MGYIVAKSSSVYTRDGKTVPTWELDYSSVNKPSLEEMRQVRSAKSSRNRSVRIFSDEQWDELPYGSRDYDWVTLDHYSVPRDKEDMA